MALFQDLLEVSKPKREPLEVPEEWLPILEGKQLYIQQMGLEERDAWDSESLKETKDGGHEFDETNVRARLLYRCIVDEDGNRVFPNASVLKPLAAHIGVPMFTHAQKINHLNRKEVEDVAKN